MIMMLTPEQILSSSLNSSIYNYINNEIGTKEDIIKMIDEIVDMGFVLSYCPHCCCMTKTINRKCAKCGGDE